MSIMEVQYERKFVPADVHFDADGNMQPTSIEVNGETFIIDKVLDVRPEACQKAGGVGDCYVCRIRGQIAKLWFGENRWWVALKVT